MVKFSKIFLFIVGVFCCQQVVASASDPVSKNAERRFEELKGIVEQRGINETIHNINTGEQNRDLQNHPLSTVMAGSFEDGGHIILVEEGKVAASPDPSEIGKDVSTDSLFKKIVEELKKSKDGKVQFISADGKTVVMARGNEFFENSKTAQTGNGKKYIFYAQWTILGR